MNMARDGRRGNDEHARKSLDVIICADGHLAIQREAQRLHKLCRQVVA